MNPKVCATDQLSAPAGRAITDTRQGFRTLVSGSFVPLDVSFPLQQQDFRASLTRIDADAVHFTEVHAGAHRVERTSRDIAAGGAGFYKVSLLLSGSSMLVQDGREMVMQPGDLTVYDTSRPYSLVFGDEFRNLIMMFPKDRLQLPLPCTDQLTAVSLSRENPELTAVVASFIANFPAQLTRLGGEVQAKLARTSVDLFATLLSSVLDVRPQQRDPRQLLLRTVKQYIEQNLGSAALSPGEIAEAHFVSTRHLHSLFRESGTTVSGWIRHRRLERCREDLTDPVQLYQTVAVISRRWGFFDPAHFSRVFKAEFGVTPSQIRPR